MQLSLHISRHFLLILSVTGPGHQQWRLCSWQGLCHWGCRLFQKQAQVCMTLFQKKIRKTFFFRQYGAGTEVPIKSLLGHRSQAPPEVRHISGQHVKEFKDFLARYPEDFVVKEEIVYLREYEGKITTTFRWYFIWSYPFLSWVYWSISYKSFH